MIIPVEKVGDIGVVSDRPANELPLNAWTICRNMRFRNGAAEKFLGEQAVMGTPLFAPHYLLHTAESGQALWLYAGLNKVAATDGAQHIDITREAGLYNTTIVGWTGTVIEGVPVINNGIDVPQMWNKPALGTKLTGLTAWPGVLRTNSLRSLKRYLIALDCTLNGTRFPNMVKWSHEAPTGNVPDSWNELDPTKDAGEYSIPGEGGFLVDGIGLRDSLILYKEHQAWRMDYVGGIDVFTFNRIFDNIGMLGRKCATEFFSGKHLVFTGDDVVVHDGSHAESVLSERSRGLLSAVDVANIGKSFVVTNYLASEVWICFPDQGSTTCTTALVWNWRTNTVGLRDLPSAAFITHGIVSEGVTASDTWDTDFGKWDDDFSVWGDRVSDPAKRRMLIACPVQENLPSTWRLILPEIGRQSQGVNVEAYLERQGLGFPVKEGNPPNYTRMKQVVGVRPKIAGTLDGEILVSLGTQESIGGPVTWSDPRPFRIGSPNSYIDFSDTETARIHAIRFESAGNVSWKMDGYDVDVIDRGEY